MIATRSESLGGETEALSPRELRAAYEAYRIRQARGLVGMLPRDVIRPLYRRAARSSSATEDVSVDPLGVLLSFCEELLPLPPFEVWRQDIAGNPGAYLHALADAADAPTAAAPETVEATSFASGGRRWVARCRAFRDSDTWRGFISFSAEPGSPVHRTTLIFREGDPAGLRERFLTFDRVALEAFLRSALP